MGKKIEEFRANCQTAAVTPAHLDNATMPENLELERRVLTKLQNASHPLRSVNLETHRDTLFITIEAVEAFKQAYSSPKGWTVWHKRSCSLSCWCYKTILENQHKGWPQTGARVGVGLWCRKRLHIPLAPKSSAGSIDDSFGRFGSLQVSIASRPKKHKLMCRNAKLLERVSPSP